MSDELIVCGNGTNRSANYVTAQAVNLALAVLL